MKTKPLTMIKLFQIFLFTSYLTLSSVNAFSQESNGYIIVNTYISADIGYCKLIVTRGDKVLEELPLNRAHHTQLASNQTEINKVLDKYKGQGYAVTNTSQGLVPIGRGGSVSAALTTYLLEKK